MLVKKIVVNLHSQFANESAEVDSVAQLVEQLTLNQWVEGSSPSGVTTARGCVKLREFNDVGTSLCDVKPENQRFG